MQLVTNIVALFSGAQPEDLLPGVSDHLTLECADLKFESARAIDDLLKGAKKRQAQANAEATKAGGSRRGNQRGRPQICPGT